MRREHDFYPTPAWATRELFKHVAVKGTVLEPCAGALDIANVLFDHSDVCDVFTNDLDRSRTHCATHEDATDARWWAALADFDWVVSNPPFSVASDIVPKAFWHAKAGVAMLLRLTYLEPCEGRAAWLAKFPPTDLIVLPRISFTGDGNTDNVTCAWFVWEKCLDARSSITVVNPVDERQGSLLESV